MLGSSRREVVTNVARALCRKRQKTVWGEQLNWNALPAVSGQTNGILLLEKNGEVLGRGVYQAGQLVYLSAKGIESYDAIAGLKADSFDASFYELEPAALTLMCSAVAGQAVQLGVSQTFSEQSLHQDLNLETFQGALMLELGALAIAVRVQSGLLEFSHQIGSVPTRYRLSQFSWLETLLPAIVTQVTFSTPPERLVYIISQFEELMRSYIGLEASTVVQAVRQELLNLNETQIIDRLKQRLKRIGSSVAEDFEARVKR